MNYLFSEKAAYFLLSFLFINKSLWLSNLRTRTAMNAKISVFVICVEAILYLLLGNSHDCTFRNWIIYHSMKNVCVLHCRGFNIFWNEKYYNKSWIRQWLKVMEKVFSSKHQRNCHFFTICDVFLNYTKTFQSASFLKLSNKFTLNC